MSESIGHEVYLVGTPRKDGNMPGPEKMIGPTGDATLFLVPEGAESYRAAQEKLHGYPFAVFRGTLTIEEKLPLTEPDTH